MAYESPKHNTILRIVGCLMATEPIEVACSSVGVEPDEVRDWIKQDKTLLMLFIAARSHGLYKWCVERDQPDEEVRDQVRVQRLCEATEELTQFVGEPLIPQDEDTDEKPAKEEKKNPPVDIFFEDFMPREKYWDDDDDDDDNDYEDDEDDNDEDDKFVNDIINRFKNLHNKSMVKTPEHRQVKIGRASCRERV